MKCAKGVSKRQRVIANWAARLTAHLSKHPNDKQAEAFKKGLTKR
jgi:hypothetical protein